MVSCDWLRPHHGGPRPCARSCTSILRVIPVARKPGKMLPLHHRVGGFTMGAHLFCYPLRLLGLLWLCLMLP
jgi:hypothetical protein